MLEEKLKKKRKKKKTDTGLGMYVVDDDDDAWNDGLSKQGKGKDLWQDERTEYDEEQPTVVGDGAEDYDPESQPIVANAEEFFERERTEELEKQWLAAETKPSDPSEASSPSRQKEDLSPPRKRRIPLPLVAQGTIPPRLADPIGIFPRRPAGLIGILPRRLDVGLALTMRHLHDGRNSGTMALSDPLETMPRLRLADLDELTTVRRRAVLSGKIPLLPAEVAGSMLPHHVDPIKTSPLVDLVGIRRRPVADLDLTGRRDGNASSPRRNPSNDDQLAVGGVFTGKEFKAQQDQLRATQQAAFQDEALMGKQAETIYRDKRGRKLDMLMEMQRQQEIQDGKRKREAKEEFEWGTGKVRKEELRSHQQELDAMRAKPFARHNDDAELESLRKAKPRAFDPMESSLFKDDVDDTAKKGPKKNQKPTYAGPPAPPNRFNIPPGYRWDGVVRGNNWEEKALLQVNARKAHKQDMYQWATADM
ncbi:hypothetical protein B5M09_004129 [Aphanomyces astaci]|uniref:Pre-mRNA-splicing factor CWC26 n=1 Tax=Aphanomyces astaci TaxID=112090 RepID=A0A425CW37_APHAT|nr:hypothetical protein B5M09_004129 [Aphanomyces astaci]